MHQQSWKLARPAQRRKLALTQDILTVVAWLKATFYVGESGSIAKKVVYAEYCAWCDRTRRKKEQASFFGKVVRQAFPGIESERRGPRGSAKQHYRHLNYLHKRNHSSSSNISAQVTETTTTTTTTITTEAQQPHLLVLGQPRPADSLDGCVGFEDDCTEQVVQMVTEREPFSPSRPSIRKLDPYQSGAAVNLKRSPVYHTHELLQPCVSHMESPRCSPPNVPDTELQVPTHGRSGPSPPAQLALGFRDYHKALLQAVLFGADEDVKRVIEHFWARTMPRLCQGLRPEGVEAAMVQHEGEGTAWLREELLANTYGIPEEELNELLTNLACYLPLWVKLLTVSLLPPHVVMLLTDIWNNFGQSLYATAQLARATVAAEPYHGHMAAESTCWPEPQYCKMSDLTRTPEDSVMGEESCSYLDSLVGCVQPQELMRPCAQQDTSALYSF